MKKGDTVLCSTLTFVASASPILYLQAIPLFVDADRSSWNLDPNLLEDALARSARRDACRGRWWWLTYSARARTGTR